MIYSSMTCGSTLVSWVASDSTQSGDMLCSPFYYSCKDNDFFANLFLSTTIS